LAKNLRTCDSVLVEITSEIAYKVDEIQFIAAAAAEANISRVSLP
jgi:sortase (surface protein transpeptidase)